MALISVNDLIDLYRRKAEGDVTDTTFAAAPLVIVDTRFYLADHGRGRREFDNGHLPAAVFVDLHDELADTSIAGAGRHPLPSTKRFGELLDRLGITPASSVVVYDDHGGAMAARFWWMLDSVGHDAVYVLDGGIQAWTAADRPLEAGPASDAIGAGLSATDSPYPVPTEWGGTVSADAVGDNPDRSFALIDSRAPERYRGESEPLDPRAGHIPGALNRFHGDVVDDAGRFRSRAELAVHFGDLGPAPVVYCGSGVTACHNLLAMRVAGIDNAVLFPGSWSEWSRNPSRPVAVGEGT